MAYYCSVADVGSRLGLDSAQRSRASSRITRHIRQATIFIDQSFLEYGRDEPSREIGETTANGAVAAGATSIVLTSGTEFAHVLREICADLSAGQYLEDEGTHQTGADGGLRGKSLRDRGQHCLQRLAHLGKA